MLEKLQRSARLTASRVAVVLIPRCVCRVFAETPAPRQERRETGSSGCFSPLLPQYRQTSCLLRQPLALLSSLFCNRRSGAALLSAEAAEEAPRANVAVHHHRLIPLGQILKANQTTNNNNNMT